VLTDYPAEKSRNERGQRKRCVGEMGRCRARQALTHTTDPLGHAYTLSINFHFSEDGVVAGVRASHEKTWNLFLHYEVTKQDTNRVCLSGHGQGHTEEVGGGRGG
jgi:hypothetical protein